jgi:long-chain acyl-CoA synthetase
MKAATTLPRLLHRNASSLGSRPALREKRGGIWQAISWADYAALVSRFAAGLAAHGFGRGDKLAVIGDNRVRLYGAVLAAQSLGGAGVPLWPDAEPDWIAQVLHHAGVSVVVAEDAEQVEKLVAIKDRLPDLTLVVQAASHGMRRPDHAWLKSFEAVNDAGAHAAVEQSEPDELALLLYGSTAGGAVRGVMLSHANLLTAADALIAGKVSGKPTRPSPGCRWPGSVTRSPRRHWPCRLVSPATVRKDRKPRGAICGRSDPRSYSRRRASGRIRWGTSRPGRCRQAG